MRAKFKIDVNSCYTNILLCTNGSVYLPGIIDVAYELPGAGDEENKYRRRRGKHKPLSIYH